MSAIHFDITGDNSNIVNTINDTTKRLESLSTVMKSVGNDADFDTSNSKKQLNALGEIISQNEKEIDNYIERIKKLQTAQEEAALAGDTDKVKQYGDALEEQAKRMQELISETANLKQNYDSLNESAGRNEGIMVKLLGGQEKYNTIISSLPGPLRAVISDLNGMTGAAKAFIATPLGAVLAALILAYQTISTWLHRTAEGQQTLAKISGYLSGVMSALRDIVAKVGKALYNAFSNPKEAAQDFLNFLKNQVVNRVMALGGIFTNLGKIIKNVFTGDFDAVREASKELGDLAIQFGTGFDADSVKKATKETVEGINNIAKAEAALNERRFKLSRNRAAWEPREASLRQELSEQRSLMYTGSTEERTKAAARAEEIINEIYRQRIAFAQEEYSIKKASNALTESSQEDLNEEKRLLAAITQERTARQNEINSFNRRGHTAENSAIKAAIKQEEELNSLLWENEEQRISLIRDAGERENAEIALRYEKRKAAIEKIRKQWAEENRLNKGDATLTDEQTKALDEADKLNERERNEAHLNLLLEQSKTYTEKRAELVKKGEQDILDLKAAGYDEQAEVRRKALAKELNDLDRQNKDIYKRLAQDTTKWGIVAVQKAITDAQAELDALSETPESATANAEAIDYLKKAIEQLKGVANDFSISGALKMLLKEDESEGKSGASTGTLAERFKAMASAWKNMSKEAKWKNLGGWTSKIASGLQQAAEYMSQVAELSGDTKLEDTARALSNIGNLAASIGSGAATGGWVGAIVGGVSSLFGIATQNIVEASLKEAEAAQNARDWQRALEMLNITVDATKFDTIFGVKNIQKAEAYYKSALEAIRAYQEKYLAVDDESGNLFYSQAKWLYDIDPNLVGGNSAIGAYYNAIKNGYNKLQSLKIETYAPNWWEKLWGSRNWEYQNLADYAPDIFDENGEIIADKAREFLETNTIITGEQRKQIENAIELKEAYDEAIKAVDDQISQTFGNLSSDITDIIWDSVMTGSDAWEQFEQVGGEAIASLGKQLIQEMLISEYLEQFRDRMRDAYKAENPADTQEQLRGIVGDIFAGLEGAVASGTMVAEEWRDWAEERGFDLAKLSSKGQNATAGGFETMNQEVATELNGRFTAFQLSNELISQSAQAGIEFLSSISDMTAAGNSTLEEIRNFHMLETGYLEEIARYTKSMTAFGEQLERIQENTSKL